MANYDAGRGIFCKKGEGGKGGVGGIHSQKIHHNSETDAHCIFCVWEMFGNIIETHAHVVGVVAR